MRKEGGLTMYEIKVKSGFNAAHNLKNYHGKCERLHGHNWNIEVVFLSKTLDKSGIALDFRATKELLNKTIEKLDHSYLNEVMKDIDPTSENIARLIYDTVKKKNKLINSVTVWENENSCATYYEKKR